MQDATLAAAKDLLAWVAHCLSQLQCLRSVAFDGNMFIVDHASLAAIYSMPHLTRVNLPDLSVGSNASHTTALDDALMPLMHLQSMRIPLLLRSNGDSRPADSLLMHGSVN